MAHHWLMSSGTLTVTNTLIHLPIAVYGPSLADVIRYPLGQDYFAVSSFMHWGSKHKVAVGWTCNVAVLVHKSLEHIAWCSRGGFGSVDDRKRKWRANSLTHFRKAITQSSCRKPCSPVTKPNMGGGGGGGGGGSKINCATLVHFFFFLPFFFSFILLVCQNRKHKVSSPPVKH